jgi:hypothetical protein
MTSRRHSQTYSQLQCSGTEIQKTAYIEKNAWVVCKPNNKRILAITALAAAGQLDEMET